MAYHFFNEKATRGRKSATIDPVCGVQQGGGGNTYSSGCVACSDNAVIDYSEGACADDGDQKQDKDSGILLADVVPILEQWAQRIRDRIVGLRSEAK